MTQAREPLPKIVTAFDPEKLEEIVLESGRLQVELVPIDPGIPLGHLIEFEIQLYLAPKGTLDYEKARAERLGWLGTINIDNPRANNFDELIRRYDQVLDIIIAGEFKARRYTDGRLEVELLRQPEYIQEG